MAVWSVVKLSELEYTRIDADYYKPEYLEIDKKIKSNNYKKLIDLSIKITDFGAFSQNNFIEYKQNGTHYFIRNQDIDSMFIADKKIFITKSVYSKLSLKLEENDLLLQRTGSIGKSGMVLKKDLPSSANQNLAQIKLNHSNINPYYVNTFLNSNIGKKNFERLATGNVQPWLNLGQIENIKVPILEESAQLEIEKIVKKYYQLRQQSQTLYKEAEELLEKELGLDGLEFEKPRSYIAKLSEVYSHNRCDADFYQTKYKQIDYVTNHIKKIPIKNISERLETGQYSSEYSENGTRSYIRGTDIDNTNQVNMEKLLKTSKLIPKNNNTVICNDLLVTRVGSIGVVGIVDELLDGSFFSDNLIRIRIKKDLLKEILPNYLNLLLSSSYGQNQMIRFSRGSVQQRLNQTQLGEIPIPIIDLQKQILIENLIIDSKQALKQSKQLLEDAKAKVEALIEEATR